MTTAFDVPTLIEQMAEKRRLQEQQKAIDEQAGWALNVQSPLTTLAIEANRQEKLLLIYESRQEEQRREQRRVWVTGVFCLSPQQAEEVNFSQTQTKKMATQRQEPTVPFGVSSLQDFAGAVCHCLATTSDMGRIRMPN
jgi:hypothetical protein